jgi:hypothetical protein
MTSSSKKFSFHSLEMILSRRWVETNPTSNLRIKGPSASRIVAAAVLIQDFPREDYISLPIEYCGSALGISSVKELGILMSIDRHPISYNMCVRYNHSLRSKSAKFARSLRYTGTLRISMGYWNPEERRGDFCTTRGVPSGDDLTCAKKLCQRFAKMTHTRCV